MNSAECTTYTPGKLLITIVTRDQGETVMAVAKRAGARGGTIMLGRGSMDNHLLQMLGLDTLELDVVFTLLSHAETPAVLAGLQADSRCLKMARGMAMCLDVGGILRHVTNPSGLTAATTPNLEAESAAMSSNASHELISVIVNAGYADDIMVAARKAGAPGGTVINARGTGKEEDLKFFGIAIVPEKEFIMILVPKDRADEILEAVKNVSCLNKPGIGIAFCMDVERFIPLGKRPA